MGSEGVTGQISLRRAAVRGVDLSPQGPTLAQRLSVCHALFCPNPTALLGRLWQAALTQELPVDLTGRDWPQLRGRIPHQASRVEAMTHPAQSGHLGHAC